MATEREKEKGFSKTDMERVALFQEMGYICIGDKYRAADSRMYFQVATYWQTVFKFWWIGGWYLFDSFSLTWIYIVWILQSDASQLICLEQLR